ncbi:c-type cytochrome domain-containing protein [Planctomycetaceae bacterium SH139]
MRRHFQRASTRLAHLLPARLQVVVMLAVVFLFAGGFASRLPAVEITPAQRASLRAAFDAVRAAGLSYQQQKFETAGKQLLVAMRKAGAGLQDADEETFTKAESILVQIERAHALLQLEGVVLPPFARPRFGEPWRDYAAPVAAPPRRSREQAPADPDATDAAGMETTSPPAAAGMQAGQDGISFVNQVAPLLVDKCGQCHIRGNRGSFSLSSFAVLMRGPPAGVVVFPGDPIGSRLIETIETGDMPRGGGSVTPAELAMLKEWVSAGAKFDGANSAAPLVNLVAANSSAPAADAAMPNVRPPQVTAATGSETVSFVRQVAPLLVENCSGCHIDAMQIVGGLNMNSLAQLLRGGDSGPAINVGDGDGSLLVRKLRGQEGQRMPAGGRPALSTESIQLISKWIDEGASLDSGGSPDQRLPVMVVEAWAKQASHQELASRRRELAIENWKLGASAETRDQPTIVENKDVLVFGTESEEQLEVFAQSASEALEQVMATLPKPRQKLDSGDAQVRGRITLFVFPRRYEYGEFSKMVEGRDLPAEWSVHWNFDGVDAYVSLVAPSEITKEALAPRLISPLASIQLAMRGSGPRWFREGLGRAVAARLAGRELPEIQQWDAAIPAALRVVKQPKELIDGRLPPAETDVLGYGIGKTMLDRSYSRELNRLLANLESGAPFDEAFATAFRVPLQNFVTTWFAYAANARGR